jgi:hypothetical protein
MRRSKGCGLEFYRVRKGKKPMGVVRPPGSAKPSMRTQELPKNDLKRFLKRVSTPSGTKAKATSVMSSTSSAGGPVAVRKPSKNKPKKHTAIVLNTKKPSSNVATPGAYPKSSMLSMAKYITQKPKATNIAAVSSKPSKGTKIVRKKSKVKPKVITLNAYKI